MTKQEWKYGQKYTFKTLVGLQAFFEFQFPMFERTGKTVQVIGKTLYVFDKHSSLQIVKGGKKCKRSM